MLKQRLLTALLVLPPLVAALYFLPLAGIMLLFTVVFALAAWEWAALAGLARARLAYAMALTAAGLLVTVLALAPQAADVAPYVLMAAVMFWLWMLFELLVVPPAARWMTLAPAGKVASGFGVLIPAWAALVYLHGQDPERPSLLLFLLVLVAVADTVAYFAGHAFGRVRLAPAISPGKTVEGAACGLIAVALLAYFSGNLIWRFDNGRLVTWVGLCVVAALFSILGDLVESKFKRLAGVKDSGRLLPGHGGMLDRIDALTGAAPVFALGWTLFFQEAR